MGKISLIIEREYKTRVMKPAFIILTFLTPLLIVGMIMVPMWLAGMKDDTVKKILIVDKTGLYAGSLTSTDSYQFTISKDTLTEPAGFRDSYIDFAVLYISQNLADNPNSAVIYSEQQIGMELKSYISSQLSMIVEKMKMDALNVPDLKELMEKVRADLQVNTVKWGKDGEEKVGSAELSLIVGMITAFIIYLFMVIYGTQVMQGVVQEKTSRIVEVIISSVRPFDLMMGKIVGIALVGLTQVLLWIVLSGVFLAILLPVFGIDMQALQSAQSAQMMTGEMDKYMQIGLMLRDFDFVRTGIMFLFYFLGGYFLYASLFAAVGSAVDQETDTQQFTLPLMLPIIFAIYAAIYSAENPDGPLAFWCSIIPFTSPIVMMVRLPFDVPVWQLVLSMALLVITFIGTTWMAGKIYRTGILMYGKKVTWKEMIKWIRY